MMPLPTTPDSEDAVAQSAVSATPTANEAGGARAADGTRPERVLLSRRARWDRYQPRPAVTLLTFAAGIALGVGLFFGRSAVPALTPAPTSAMPQSPYTSLPGTMAAPFSVVVVMDGLTSSAAGLPAVLSDTALAQLKRELDPFIVVASVEHQGSIIVGNQAVSALLIRGIDLQGRSRIESITAYVIDGEIVEFR